MESKMQSAVLQSFVIILTEAW